MIKKIIFSIWSFVVLSSAKLTYGAVNVNGSDLPGYSLTVQGLFDTITRVACWITRFALLLMVVMIVFYGVQFMLARDNPTAFGKAKTGFFKALIGIIIILGTYTIIATIGNAFDANYSVIPLNCSSY